MPATASSPTPTGTSPNAKVWLITGCSSGFGKQIAIAARSRGDLVITTARKISALEPLQAIGCDALALDITTDEATVKRVVEQAHAIHGRIDVLVNNAGISSIRSVESVDDAEAVHVMNTNVFGLLRVTRAVLPFMRAQQSGTIANIGSVASRAIYPGNSIYSASKAAVAAISQTLRVEVAAFNIDVVVIEPGLFRTQIASNFRTVETEIDVYVATTNLIKEYAATTKDIGDPVKGARLIVEALTQTGHAAGRKLPARLPLGPVFEGVEATLANDLKEVSEWKDFTDASLFSLDDQ
jgi:NADP-dependent 3-hydroxy acid dehydrogenase YdfG